MGSRARVVAVAILGLAVSGCAGFQPKPLVPRDVLRELQQVRLEALAATVLRFRQRARAGERLGPETGMLKLLGSRLIQDIENLAVDALGPGTLAYDRSAHFEPAMPQPGHSAYAAAASARRFVTRGYTIAGGSSEIQHELLAKQVLGL